MKRTFLTLTLTLLSSVTLFAATPSLDDVVKSVKDEFAPDRRTELFNIEVAEYPSVIVLTGRTTSPEALKAVTEKVSALADGRQVVNDVALLPDAEKLDNKIFGVVDIAVATVRSSGNYSSEAVTQLLMGMPVRILDDDGWYYVQTPEGYLGWVAKRSIKTMTREEYNDWVEADKTVYLPVDGSIYSEPDARSQQVSDVVAGAILLKGDKKAVSYTHLTLPTT